MAGIAKPNVDGLGKETTVNFLSSRTDYTPNFKIELFDGSLSSTNSVNSALFFYTSYTGCFVEFEVTEKCRIWGYTLDYSDSGGNLLNPCALYKKDETTNQYVFVKNSNTPIANQWYTIFDELEVGTYKIQSSARTNYSGWTEWYIEKLEKENINPLKIKKTLKDNLPTSIDSSRDELHFTEDGGIYLSKNDGTIRQVGIDDETKDKIQEMDDKINDLSQNAVFIEPSIQKGETEDTPVGHIMSFMGLSAPKHYLVCDGSEYNIVDYPYLAEFIETEFGQVNYFGGDGVTTFAVPDLRGEFLRGTGTATRDTGTGAKVGKHQDATIHLYGQTATNGDVQFSNSPAQIRNADKVYGHSATVKYVESGNTRTWSSHSDTAFFSTYNSRPTNTSVLYCIKYEPTYYMEIIDTKNENFIINEMSNPLTLNPLEYGYFKLSANVSNYVANSNILFDTIIDGNMSLQNGLIRLNAGKTYKIDFSTTLTHPNSNAYAVAIGIYDNDTGERLLTCNQVAPTYSVAMSDGDLHGVITPVKDIDICVRCNYDMTTISSNATNLVIQEVRNNPVNQYGGFETEVLFEGNISQVGMYNLNDSVLNYDFLYFIGSSSGYNTDKYSKLTSVLCTNDIDFSYPHTHAGQFGMPFVYRGAIIEYNFVDEKTIQYVRRLDGDTNITYSINRIIGIKGQIPSLLVGGEF